MRKFIKDVAGKTHLVAKIWCNCCARPKCRYCHGTGIRELESGRGGG